MKKFDTIGYHSEEKPKMKEPSCAPVKRLCIISGFKPRNKAENVGRYN